MDKTDFWDVMEEFFDQATYFGSLSCEPRAEKTAKDQALATIRKHVRALYRKYHGGMDQHSRERMAEIFGRGK